MNALRDDIRSFILERFLPGEDPANLTDDTPLVTSGVLDSLATMTLVDHLEQTYAIEIEAHETSVDNLNTVSDITGLIERKKT